MSIEQNELMGALRLADELRAAARRARGRAKRASGAIHLWDHRLARRLEAQAARLDAEIQADLAADFERHTRDLASPPRIAREVAIENGYNFLRRIFSVLRALGEFLGARK